MSHRTFRSLDEQARLIGFTFWQWLRLLALTGMTIGLVLLLGLPVKAAISVCAFTIGVPAALTYVSEAGGVQWGRLILDAGRWCWGTRWLAAVDDESPARGLALAAVTMPGGRRHK